MPWFKVDDQFHASRKLNSIPKRHRLQAAGLWAIAGSWVSGQETDGFVPDYMIQVWSPTQKTVDSLVESGLWIRENDGFRFYSWLNYNPSKEDSDAKRAASKERMRQSRERNRRRTDGESRNQPSEYAGNGSEDEDVTLQHPNVTGEALQRPDPTRPDPTRPYIDQGSQPTYGDHARETEMAGELNLDDLAAATRRARTAGISEQAITQGTAEYNKRPEPKGPGLLRTLINDAHTELTSQESKSTQRASRRAAIDACEMCDSNGMRIVSGNARRCNHQTPPF